MNTKNLLVKVVEKIHMLLFGHEMSDQMRAFLVNLSWSFYAGAIATPISIVVGTLAGRFLGPKEYGNYNLVVLISSYIIVFAFFGLDTSMMKRVVKAKSEKEQQESYFSAFVFITLMLVIISIVGAALLPHLTSTQNLPNNFVLFVILFTFLSAFKSVLDILVRALENFKLQAIVRIVEIFVMLGVFVLAVFYFKKLDYREYLTVLFCSMAAVIISYFSRLKNYFKNFSYPALKVMLSEGKFFMGGSILGTIFVSSDRLLIAKYIDVTNLGIYSAYYAASLGLVYTLSLILTNVLFPATAKSSDKYFTKKLDQLLFKGFIPIFLLIYLAIVVFFSILGKAFPFRLDYSLLFAFIATLNFFITIYGTVILDSGKKLYVRYFYVSNFINLLTIVYYFILLKYISKSIELLLVGFAVNVILTIFVQRIFVKTMRENPAAMIENAN